MKNSSFPKSHTVTHEVEINLNVLCVLMLDQVGSKVGGADVVTVDNSGACGWATKIMEKLEKPASLYNTVSNTSVLRFCTGPGHTGLSVGRP